MHLKRAHKRYRRKDFEEELFAELRENEFHLPIGDLGDGGSFGDSDIEYSNLVLRGVADGELLGSFNVRFTECINRGCRDYLHEQTVLGGISFILNIATGHMTCEAIRAPRREFDLEEI